MTSGKDIRETRGGADGRGKASRRGPSPDDARSVFLSEWKDRVPMTRGRFEGPPGVDVPLRITFRKAAYAEVVLHAKESLDREIGGVLVGEVCADDEGPFVSVQAVIRGNLAQADRAHVTFTQETWSTIHERKDKDYPDLQIVGWYHSHPGFGVEMSDMDRFIHENFFPSPAQVALVTDPLSGEAAILVNAPEGLVHVDRFWVGGREHACRLSGGRRVESAPDRSGNTAEIAENLEKVSVRLSQVIQTLDELRGSLFKFLMTLGFLICSGLIVLIGYHIYASFQSRFKPPELHQYVEVPVLVGDKAVLLGIGVVRWDVPPELNATYVRLEQVKREAQQQEAQKATQEKPDASDGGKKQEEGSGSGVADKAQELKQ